MHRTSLLKVQSFVSTYLRDSQSKRLRILDVGSKSYEGHASYRSLFDGLNVEYVGLDLEPGHGVDFVPQKTFVWPELSSDSFDICLCGQVFEHNPMFWITFAEIARVLKPNGLTMVIAPGRGAVHRYPVDCWRFYPDAWHALCAYTGLSLVESFFEDRGNRRREPSLMWCDSCVIAKKPSFDSERDRIAFHAQLEKIISTAPDTFIVPAMSATVGPAFNDYHQTIDYAYRKSFISRLKNYFLGSPANKPSISPIGQAI
ncbi:MAG: class I SAM-dependent methyltransferase [Pirellulaceae bacterium]|nr:class I SAM-dependent methyltransferase [Pirellulaceae bacterium]